ncbi:GNAT family N-acetyltransferase [Fonticella tunisiensis]|nr:GNAT family N-acetyltransferase [Fonticella tunisiensis]
MDIKYRKAENYDIDYIKKLVRENLGEVIVTSFKGDFDYDVFVGKAVMDRYSYIVLCDMCPCGFLWYSIKGAFLHVNTIVLSKEYQNKGIGSAVFKELEEFGRQINLSFLQLGVQGVNKKAIKFYERLGFINRAYVQEFDTFYMQKRIR